jgi:hypothetical protein
MPYDKIVSMDNDEKLFSFGLEFLITALLVISVFHAVFSYNEKNLAKKNKQLVTLEQDVANASVKFAALVQPEVLRPIVMEIYPNYKSIGTKQTIDARTWN